MIPRVHEHKFIDTISLEFYKDSNGVFYIKELSATPSAMITHKLIANPNTLGMIVVPIEPVKIEDEKEVTTVTTGQNLFVKDKYVTYVTITNFKEIPKLWIDTPTFKFDSYVNSDEWKLCIKQRWFGSHIGKTTIRLVRRGAHQHEPGIQIRLGKDATKIRLQSFDDVIAMFDGHFELVHSFVMTMRKPVTPVVVTEQTIDSYSDEELLAEVHRRTMSRIGEYRGDSSTPLFDFSNVVDLDSVRRIVFDDSAIMRLLSEEEAA